MNTYAPGNIGHNIGIPSSHTAKFEWARLEWCVAYGLNPDILQVHIDIIRIFGGNFR